MISEKMPKKHLRNTTLKGIKVNEIVYTVPWALMVDKDGYMWIDTEYEFTERSVGISHMKVFKNSEGWYCVYENTLNNFTYDYYENIPDHARKAVMVTEKDTSFIDWWRSL